MLNKGMFTSNTDMWETPQALFDELDKEFHFTLDVCAVPENAKCERYFTPAQNGLKQDWNTGGGHNLYEPSIRSGNRLVGTQSSGKQRHGSMFVAGADGHGVVSRLHIRQSGDPFYPGEIKIWK